MRRSAAPASFAGMSAVDTEQREARAAAAGGSAKRSYVRRMFSEIAPSYDLLNHLLSFNIDRHWRRRAVAALGWPRAPGGIFLDVCAGTLDVSAHLSRQAGFTGRVIAIDFAEPMLRRGRGKVDLRRVQPVVGDGLTLPLADGVAAGAIVAFGARNFDDLDAGLAELRRVLEPGARLVVLEFTTPRAAVVRAGYHLYFHRVLPRIGGIISGHHTAYRYLPESVARFPSAGDLAAQLTAAGFTGVGWEELTFGIAAMHWGARAG